MNDNHISLQSISEIYWSLRNKMDLSHAAVCGIMANIISESGYDSKSLQVTRSRKYLFDGDEYTRRVDSGSIDQNEFVYDGVGYGLCQWTYWTRKKDLYCFMKERGVSIGDLSGQIDYLIYELNKDFPFIVNVLRGTDARNLILKKKKVFNMTVDDSEDGAYNAAYYFCGRFEEPGSNDFGEKCEDRGEIARGLYKRYPGLFDTGILFSG